MKNYLVLTFLSLFIQLLSAQKVMQLENFQVEYKVKNAGLNSSGRFDKMTAHVVFDEQNLDKSSISATIQANSFNSGIGLRDKHLKGTDYFDVQKYPTITLVSTKIAKAEMGYAGTFDLTIKGNTRSISLPFTVNKNATHVEFKASELTIDRLSYGVGKQSLTLSNTVRIGIKASFLN